MGGGTGSGAAPVVAHIAKEKGILTVGVVTKPFSFEGKKRMEIADNALSTFTKEVDSIIIIPNQNLFRIADENTTLSEAFKLADNVLYSGVRSITELMMMPGLINLDFADVKNIMEDKGKAIMGTGEAEGKGRAKEAARQALSNPLLDDCVMKGAKGVLINITGGKDITLPELDEAANTIKEEVGDDANIIFGSSYDDGLAGKIRVSIVVTGINDGMQYKMEEKTIPTPTPSFIDESYDDTSSVPTIDMDEIETQPIDLEPEAEDVPLEDMFDGNPEEDKTEEFVSEESNALEDDFASLDKSEELPEIPQASALFNAIMNSDNKSQESEKADFEFNAASAQNDFFSSQTPLVNTTSDDEPVLFDNNDSSFFKDNRYSEPETLTTEPVEPEIEARPTFIERVMGIRARRKTHEEPHNDASIQPLEKTGTDDMDFSGEDLDIPSFLRRK